MKIIYVDRKTEKQCTDLETALKFFGGDRGLAVSLLGRVNAIKQAVMIKDIIMMPNFHFHGLKGKLDGYFAVDVKSRRDKWRIILRPLDKDEKVFAPLRIDEIASVVQIVEIKEVSAHYE